MKALVLYWSATGNTEKVSTAIVRALHECSIDTHIIKIPPDADVDLFDYDLVFIGSPSYQFLPPDPVLNYVRERMKFYNQRGDIKPGAPKVPGKTGVVFCTYSGPHTGVNEAIPVGKFLGQLLDHLGFELGGEWYTVGEFHGNHLFSTQGRCGDITGRPDVNDLAEVTENVKKLVASLR